MAGPNEVRDITKAFSGDGVDEKSLILILGKWQPDQRPFFRKETSKFFKQDERDLECWVKDSVKLLKKEFMRFQKAIILWTTHPWERDARLAKKAIKKGSQSYSLLVEIACTRSSDELLGARKAYHSLFEHSMEEEVAQSIKGNERRLLVALVSAYRFEGAKVKDDDVTFDVMALSNAIKRDDKKDLLKDDEVLRILTTRSKPHLMAVCEQYKKIPAKMLDEDLEPDLLKETVHCLCAPPKYFTKVLDAAFRPDASNKEKKALTRVMVTRADHDMNQIKEEFQNMHGVSLSKKIEDKTLGNYKDFLLTLDAKEN